MGRFVMSFFDEILKAAGKASGGSISPALMMGQPTSVLIGGVDVTKWIQDCQFTDEADMFSIDLKLTMPKPDHLKPKSKPQIHFYGTVPQHTIYDEAHLTAEEYVFSAKDMTEIVTKDTWTSKSGDQDALLNKVAKEMIEKQKGTPA